MRPTIWLALGLTATVCLAGCAPLAKTKGGKGGGLIMPPRFEGTCHEEKWDPILGTTQACGVCGGDCVGHTPATYLKQVLTCGGGCGEIYWGPWISEPPSGCDPCDDHGNWMGPQDCGPSFATRFVHSASNLFGGRDADDHAGKGCTSCVDGKGAVVAGKGMPIGKGGKGGKGGDVIIHDAEIEHDVITDGSIGAPAPPPVTSASRTVPLLRQEEVRTSGQSRFGWLPRIPLHSSRGQFRSE